MEDRGNPLLQEFQELIENLFHGPWLRRLNRPSRIWIQRGNERWVPARRIPGRIFYHLPGDQQQGPPARSVGTVDSFMISAAAHCVGVQVAVVYKSRLPPSIGCDPRVI